MNAVFELNPSIIDKNKDILVYYYGEMDCEKGYGYGPAMRDHYLFHYILKGKGIYKVNDRTYEVKANQGFLICPDKITYYEADKENPWTYAWIAFNGKLAKGILDVAGLTFENPIFTANNDKLKEYFHVLLSLDTYSLAYEFRAEGYLYLILSEFMEQAKKIKLSEQSRKEIYIKKALEFIELNYSNDISVAILAKYLNFNKNYFSTFFKEAVGISPKEYIIKYRVEQAVKLLKNTKLSVNEISRSVGYEDPLTFSKVFKKLKGVSPKKYI